MIALQTNFINNFIVISSICVGAIFISLFLGWLIKKFKVKVDKSSNSTSDVDIFENIKHPEFNKKDGYKIANELTGTCFVDKTQVGKKIISHKEFNAHDTLFIEKNKVSNIKISLNNKSIKFHQYSLYSFAIDCLKAYAKVSPCFDGKDVMIMVKFYVKDVKKTDTK